LFVPSVGEPLGRTLVEAMLLGTPVIATDSGGNPEAVINGITGKLVPPDNGQAFATAYLDLIGRPADIDKIVETARLQARERFGTERHVQAVTSVYDALIQP
jgi:glycosyltransferase involved in cell wall biosynthesis